MAATTWNPADKGAGFTLSNGNLDAVNGTAAWQSVRATNSFSSGKIYFEVLVAVADGTEARLMVGFGKSDFSLSNYVGATSTSASYQSATDLYGAGMTASGTPTTSFNTTNATVGVAIDVTNGKAWIAIGNSYLQGSPSAGTSPSVTFTGGVAIFPAVAIFGGSTGKLRLAPNSSTQTYTAPTGFAPIDVQALSLSTVAGAYSLTGLAATIHKNWAALSTVVGTYALTGSPTAMLKAWKMATVTGSYALTGVAAITKKALHMNIAVGSYALTGFAVAMPKAWKMIIAVGSYTLTGMSLIAADYPAAANLIRKANYVLQKLRTNPPTLSD